MTPISSTSITPTVPAPTSVNRTATVAEVNPAQDNTDIGLDSTQRTNRTGSFAEPEAPPSMSTTNLAALSQDRRAEQTSDVATANQARRYETMQVQTSQAFQQQARLEAQA